MGDNDPFQIALSAFEENIEDEVSTTKSKSKDMHVQFHSDAVSPLNMCETDQATKLCILDLAKKLKHSNHYDIGGTYTFCGTHHKPDFWFYYTTTKCPFDFYILNLFVCHRSMGLFKIGVSETMSLNNITMESTNNIITYVTLPDTLSWQIFKSCEVDQSHHILSLHFSQNDLSTLCNRVFCIPIKIDENPLATVHEKILTKIKIEYDLDNPFRRHENTDFILKSSSGKTYPVHKLIIATHSSVLRDMLKNLKTDSALLDIDDDNMELLQEYLYTYTIKNVTETNICQILEFATKYKLNDLLNYVGQVISEQLTIKNVVDMAILSEKYKLYNVQKNIFEFIKNNQEVKETEAWKNLNDVALTKKLFEIVYLNEKHK